jgi:hypothetical protein
MIYYLLLWMVFAHWIADFVCQTHWQATNKSKDWNALTQHVVIYSVIMTGAFAILVFKYTALLQLLVAFFFITFFAHFITDAITSRINSYLWKKGDVHNFFVSVGFDQFLHYLQLFLTIQLLGNLVNHA